MAQNGLDRLVVDAHLVEVGSEIAAKRLPATPFEAVVEFDRMTPGLVIARAVVMVRCTGVSRFRALPLPD